MTQAELDALQHLVSAAIRVVRTPLSETDTPMCRSVLALGMQLAAMGFIKLDEAQRLAHRMSLESVKAETGN